MSTLRARLAVIAAAVISAVVGAGCHATAPALDGVYRASSHFEDKTGCGPGTDSADFPGATTANGGCTLTHSTSMATRTGENSVPARRARSFSPPASTSYCRSSASDAREASLKRASCR